MTEVNNAPEVADDEDAAIDEALQALTATASLAPADEPDDGAVDVDGIGEAGVPDDDAADAMLAPIDFAEPGAGAAAAGVPDRVELLDELARALTQAQVARDSGRVRRKVAASAGGAGLAGTAGVILQLVGVLGLPPELAATVAAAAATLVSLLAGYLTPERQATLPVGLVRDVLGTR
jgi:hypothetical protein